VKPIPEIRLLVVLVLNLASELMIQLQIEIHAYAINSAIFLSDLDAATRGGLNVEGVKLPAGVRGVDTNKLAAMAIAFDVVG